MTLIAKYPQTNVDWKSWRQIKDMQICTLQVIHVLLTNTTLLENCLFIVYIHLPINECTVSSRGPNIMHIAIYFPCSARSVFYRDCWIHDVGFTWFHMQITHLTHWGRVRHICVGSLTIIVSDNGLSPGRRQAIIWTNVGRLLIGPLGTNFSEIIIEILTFSFKKMRLKASSAKWRPFCLGLNVLNENTTKHVHWWLRKDFIANKPLILTWEVNSNKWISFLAICMRYYCSVVSMRYYSMIIAQNIPWSHLYIAQGTKITVATIYGHFTLMKTRARSATITC